MSQRLQQYFNFNVMYDLAIMEAYIRTFYDFRTHLGESQRTVLFIEEGQPGGHSFNFRGKVNTFHDPAEIAAVGRALYRLVRNDAKWERLRLSLRRFGRDLLPLMTLEGTERHLAGLEEDRDFLAAYERWYRAWIDAATVYLFTDGQYHEYSLAEVMRELERFGRGAPDVARLARQNRPSIFQRANDELARVGRLYRRRARGWELAFRELLDRYLWLYVADTHYDLPGIIAGLRARLKDRASPNPAAGRRGVPRVPRRVPRSILTIIERIAELGFQRAELRPFWQYADFMIHKVFEGFERTHGLPRYFLAFLTHRETVDLMARFNRQKVRRLGRRRDLRMRHLGILMVDGAVSISHDPRAIERLRARWCRGDGASGSLVGQVAYCADSMITARARVVPWTQRIAVKLAALEPGEIVVVNQVKPDFLPFLWRVGAIVADEGGITSHSSVVSREFKIPAIVGTRIATATFRTGDTLRIDFARGEVSVVARQQ